MGNLYTDVRNVPEHNVSLIQAFKKEMNVLESDNEILKNNNSSLNEQNEELKYELRTLKD